MSVSVKKIKLFEDFELCREEWQVKKKYVFSLKERILVMLLGFCCMFRFLMISGILMIYLVFTKTLQRRWGRYCYARFLEDQMEAQNVYETPPGSQSWSVSEPPACWTMSRLFDNSCGPPGYCSDGFIQGSVLLKIHPEFCLLSLLALPCSWPWIFLGTRIELTCKK